MNPKLLTSAIITSRLETVERYINDFNILTFMSVPDTAIVKNKYPIYQEPSIGEAEVYGDYKIIYQDVDTENYYYDLVKFEKIMKIYLEDDIVMSVTPEEKVIFTFNQRLQERFEALYFRGLI